MNVEKRIRGALALAAAFAWLSAAPLRADDTSANLSIGKMITNLKISGDFRIRQRGGANPRRPPMFLDFT